LPDVVSSLGHEQAQVETVPRVSNWHVDVRGDGSSFDGLTNLILEGKDGSGLHSDAVGPGHEDGEVIRAHGLVSLFIDVPKAIPAVVDFWQVGKVGAFKGPGDSKALVLGVVQIGVVVLVPVTELGLGGVDIRHVDCC
jgi:hypothetical protein